MVTMIRTISLDMLSYYLFRVLSSVHCSNSNSHAPLSYHTNLCNVADCRFHLNTPVLINKFTIQMVCFSILFCYNMLTWWLHNPSTSPLLSCSEISPLAGIFSSVRIFRLSVDGARAEFVL